MSGIVKGVKKVIKGVGKVVKKVVKGVVKLGKNIVKGVGKVMGKLGPIGTIAIGFLAPYAIGALAGSSVGWVSAIGKGLQAVSSAAAAPFKIAGQALGKGISVLGKGVGEAIGGTIGQGFSTVTDKITSFLGYQGGSVADGAKNIMNSVGQQWNEAFGTSFSTTPTSTFDATFTKGLEGTQLGYKGEGTSLLDPFETGIKTPTPTLGQKPVPSYGEALQSITPKFQGVDTSPEAMQGAYERVGIDTAKPYEIGYQKPSTGLTDTLKKLSQAFSGFTPPSPMSQLPGISTEGYNLQSAEAGRAGGPGGTGTSFWAQEQTGLLRTEDFAQQAFSLLNKAYA